MKNVKPEVGVSARWNWLDSTQQTPRSAFNRVVYDSACGRIVYNSRSLEFLRIESYDRLVWSWGDHRARQRVAFRDFFAWNLYLRCRGFVLGWVASPSTWQYSQNWWSHYRLPPVVHPVWHNRFPCLFATWWKLSIVVSASWRFNLEIPSPDGYQDGRGRRRSLSVRKHFLAGR